MQVKNISYPAIIILFIFSSLSLSAQQNKKDESGRKQGNWVKYKDGVKFYEGQFIDDYPHGEFLRYYPSGRLKSKAVFSNQGKRNLAEFYYDDRKKQLKAKGLYLEREKDSLWSLYNESGVLISEESYHHDIADGNWKLYNYVGALVKETPYHHGLINGEQKEYFENGNLQRLITFQMDTINGAFLIYYPEGSIRTEGQFTLGVQDQEWKYYQPDGQILFIETYLLGELLHRLDTDGKEFKLEVEQDSIRLDVDPAEMDFR